MRRFLAILVSSVVLSMGASAASAGEDSPTRHAPAIWSDAMPAPLVLIDDDDDDDDDRGRRYHRRWDCDDRSDRCRREWRRWRGDDDDDDDDDDRYDD